MRHVCVAHVGRTVLDIAAKVIELLKNEMYSGDLGPSTIATALLAFNLWCCSEAQRIATMAYVSRWAVQLSICWSSQLFAFRQSLVASSVGSRISRRGI